MFIVENSFPISTSGILGLDWEITNKAIINRELNTYIVKTDNQVFLLEFGYHFFDGPNIVPGVYHVQDKKVTLNLFNDGNENRFLYRENITTKPQDKFLYDTEKDTKTLHAKIESPSCSKLSTQDGTFQISLNTKISHAKGKHALALSYQSNMYLDTNSKPRVETKILHIQNNTHAKELPKKYLKQKRYKAK